MRRSYPRTESHLILNGAQHRVVISSVLLFVSTSMVCSSARKTQVLAVSLAQSLLELQRNRMILRWLLRRFVLFVIYL
jgi:hypothetical protein